MNTTINKTDNGHMYKCSSCDKIHIEFNNFLFSFSTEEYKYFKNCIFNIDGAYYEHINARLNYNRRIIVPIGHKNVTMLLHKNELTELKQLLVQRPEDNSIGYYISCKEIGVKLSSN